MGQLTQIDKVKTEFLERLQTNLGIISHTCNEVGICRQTFYNWLKLDESFAKAVKMIDELTIDHVESKLMDLINDKTPSAVIFYLKTKGRARGYTQSTNIDISNSDGSLNNRILTTNPLLEDNNIQDAEVVED